ncbi:uncharacterized protein BO97DRAFT_343345, partial [Aspergillus homomorphus CBS 101889]
SSTMCEFLVALIHFHGCPATCDTTSRFLNRCASAKQTGVDCSDPKDKILGKTTYPSHCPKHRDEGYSRR